MADIAKPGLPCPNLTPLNASAEAANSVRRAESLTLQVFEQHHDPPDTPRGLTITFKVHYQTSVALTRGTSKTVEWSTSRKDAARESVPASFGPHRIVSLPAAPSPSTVAAPPGPALLLHVPRERRHRE